MSTRARFRLFLGDTPVGAVTAESDCSIAFLCPVCGRVWARAVSSAKWSIAWTAQHIPCGETLIFAFRNPEPDARAMRTELLLTQEHPSWTS